MHRRALIDGLLRFARNDGAPISWQIHSIERRIAIAAPPNRLMTQRRLLHGAGGDARGFGNGARVQSISNAGPGWADYARGASAWRDHRSSHHCARTT